MILELPCRCEAANTLPMYVSAKFPERIVCLTEETTETLYLLGEERRIVGISGFTVRPARARREKPKVSAFTSANIERIVELKPDLVLGFSDLQADIAATLIRAGIEVHVFNHRTVPEILRMIGVLGGMIGCEGKAAALIDELNAGLAAVSARARALSARPAVDTSPLSTSWLAAMPGRCTTGTIEITTCGNCTRWFLTMSSCISGLSELAKSTVLASICLMPPPEPIAW